MKKIGFISLGSRKPSMEYVRRLARFTRMYTNGEQELSFVQSGIEFKEIENLKKRGRWDVVTQVMADNVKADLSRTDFCLIGSIELHKVYQQLIAGTGVEILHIADALGEYLKERGFSTVLLLGTKETMESDFISSILLNDYEVETIIPEEKDREYLDQAIITELCHDKFSEDTCNEVITIVGKGKERGAQAVIQASTELPLLFTQDDLSLWADIPVVNAVKVHADAAIRKALGL